MRKSRGFSLIELLIVVVIIAVLMMLLLPAFSRFTFLVNQDHCKKNLKAIYSVFQAYCSMNDGFYPFPVDTYYGGEFMAPYNAADHWSTLTQVKQMQMLGAKVDIFFCPFDPKYGQWDAWPQNSWKDPFTANWGDPWQSYVYVGYSLFIYRGYMNGSPHPGHMFRDGRYPVGSTSGDADVPIVADRLWLRVGSTLMGGWYHGGGVNGQTGDSPGLFNSDCNTLFNGGYVVTSAAEDFTPDNYAFSMSSDYWWCALSGSAHP